MENFGAAGSYNGGTQPILGRHQESPPLCKGLRHELRLVSSELEEPGGQKGWKVGRGRGPGRDGGRFSPRPSTAGRAPACTRLSSPRPWRWDSSSHRSGQPEPERGLCEPPVGSPPSLCPALPGLAPGPRLLQAVLHARGPGQPLRVLWAALSSCAAVASPASRGFRWALEKSQLQECRDPGGENIFLPVQRGRL